MDGDPLASHIKARLVTLKEAARLTGRSYTTIQKWAATGVIHSCGVSDQGRRIKAKFYDLRDVEKVCRERPSDDAPDGYITTWSAGIRLDTSPTNVRHLVASGTLAGIRVRSNGKEMVMVELKSVNEFAGKFRKTASGRFVPIGYTGIQEAAAMLCVGRMRAKKLFDTGALEGFWMGRDSGKVRVVTLASIEKLRRETRAAAEVRLLSYRAAKMAKESQPLGAA